VATLLANDQMANNENMDAVCRAAWYDKSYPTFSDALALVRKELWAQEQTFTGRLHSPTGLHGTADRCGLLRSLIWPKSLYSITYPLLLFDGPGNDSSPRASRMCCHRPCLTHSSWRR
jgi:hypothetical protein